MIEQPFSVSISGDLDTKRQQEREPVQIRSHLAWLIEQVKNLETQIEWCRGWLAEYLGEGDHKLADGSRLSVHTSRRFDPALAKAMLPAHIYASCCRPVVQRDLVLRLVSPEEYRACQSAGKPVVRLLS